MSDLLMSRKIKLKILKKNVSMTTKVSSRQTFYKNTASSKQIILVLQREI